MLNKIVHQSPSLLIASYDPFSVDASFTFSPVKKTEVSPSEKPIPFNSAVADLRCGQEPRAANLNAWNEQIASPAEGMFPVIRPSKKILDDSFEPEPEIRPTQPIYQTNEERDTQVPLSDQKPKHRLLKIADILWEFSQRLQVSEERGGCSRDQSWS
jgi:hypothetical protein